SQTSSATGRETSMAAESVKSSALHAETLPSSCSTRHSRTTVWSSASTDEPLNNDTTLTCRSSSSTTTDSKLMPRAWNCGIVQPTERSSLTELSWTGVPSIPSGALL